MSIAFVIPSMRPNRVKRVLHDLDNQTVVPNRVVLVDNSTRFVTDRSYKFKLEIVCHGKNIGTNPVWNMALRFKENFCGILGDDYRLEATLIEKLRYGLLLRCDGVRTGATVPEIVQTKKFGRVIKQPFVSLDNIYPIRLGRTKGFCSAVLMTREVAHAIPLIPKCFKIFFGDNWIGYHITHTLKLGFIQIKPCFVYHTPGPDNVSVSLNYKEVLLHERGFWKDYIRSQVNR